MGRKLKKKEEEALGCLIMIGLAIWGLSWIVENIYGQGNFEQGVQTIVKLAIFSAGVTIVYKIVQPVLRRGSLMKKYGDRRTVRAIMEKQIWEGMSDEQLRDALGAPEATDETLRSGRKTETWKYHHTGGNRFALRVTLENGLVSGWQKLG